MIIFQVSWNIKASLSNSLFKEEISDSFSWRFFESGFSLIKVMNRVYRLWKFLKRFTLEFSLFWDNWDMEFPQL